tara:strand:+ start:144 stop:515 length:372 start_codon:yes stop_codon:yes gene_type:complete
MGLDNYFRYPAAPGETAPVIGKLDVALCGGLFSGNGEDGSFRGKVYYDTLKEICGVSIYNEVSPSKCVEMADALKEYVAGQVGAVDDKIAYIGQYGITFREVKDLEKVFRAFGEQGYYLHAWY